MNANTTEFYINGQWVAPLNGHTRPLINPATEQQYATVAMGDTGDVDAAVDAAKGAFSSWSKTPVAERMALFERIIGGYKKRFAEIAQAITQEMGAPASLSQSAQAAMGLGHFAATLNVLKNFAFSQRQGTTEIRKEPIGVVGLITPWNWPMNQVICKVAPALAAGCTIVLKPSQDASLSAALLAEILHEAGVPAGVFNVIQGAGAKIGDYMSRHADIDMISFTGSTQAGTQVAKAAADTVKRVALELGGKSANIILDDADITRSVTNGIKAVFANSGQTCTAPTRMLVPNSLLPQALAVAKAVGEASIKAVGDPTSDKTGIGPVAHQRQFEKIQEMIAKGIDEGATLLCGGLGKPAGLETGYYVKPTIFSDVTNDMTIAREEIFGPVLVIIGYEDDADAVRIANDSPYGLSGYVSGTDVDRVRLVASQMRTGMVHLNDAKPDLQAPFGGYKQSGNGREWGEYGLEDFLEVKSVLGWHNDAE
ncbi:aldehyde dehydrogenase family protein [Alteromonas gilva]|uniref:aldehyde dehydrogenase (NAD(+)) n=1 Tax=Alteromonas gilva TaxID=2987522 RepID=A0ABT5KZS5_9ALTE|nr:aldehyde dehydrogenase family protein [Alteromonas gilva]MDC8830132.1 aldehyde dehydrogenase family protein [Alteromonas gilva]